MKLKTADIIQYRKEYNENNKDKFFEKVICNICRGSYSKCNKSNHYKSKRHIACDSVSKKIIDLPVLSEEEQIKKYDDIIKELEEKLLIKERFKKYEDRIKELENKIKDLS